MTWTKLGDEYADECWTLSDKAFRLHAEGLLWSNRKLLDGRLPKDEIHHPNGCRWVNHPDAAEELVSVGWWEDRDGHYQIVHHIGYQRTRAQVAHQSNVNTKNRALGKARPVRSSKKSSDESSDERDWTGLDRPGLKGDQLTKRDDAKKGDDYAADYRDWCAADDDPSWPAMPMTDPDGFPLDDGR